MIQANRGIILRIFVMMLFTSFIGAGADDQDLTVFPTVRPCFSFNIIGKGSVPVCNIWTRENGVQIAYYSTGNPKLTLAYDQAGTPKPFYTTQVLFPPVDYPWTLVTGPDWMNGSGGFITPYPSIKVFSQLAADLSPIMVYIICVQTLFSYTLLYDPLWCSTEEKGCVIVQTPCKHCTELCRLLDSVKRTSKPTSRPTSAKPLITSQPSLRPASKFPSRTPIAKPTTRPSIRPSSRPSAKPSGKSSPKPSSKPSSRPSSKTSLRPSFRPSIKPSFKPSLRPSSKTSLRPSFKPSMKASVIRPSPKPSPRATSFVRPSTKPSMKPSVRKPSSRPSSFINSPLSIIVSAPSIRPTTPLPQFNNLLFLGDSLFQFWMCFTPTGEAVIPQNSLFCQNYTSNYFLNTKNLLVDCDGVDSFYCNSQFQHAFPGALNFGRSGLSISQLQDFVETDVTLHTLASLGPPRTNHVTHIVISIGTNSLLFAGVPFMIAQLKRLVAAVRLLFPDADIMLLAVTPSNYLVSNNVRVVLNREMRLNFGNRQKYPYLRFGDQSPYFLNNSTNRFDPLAFADGLVHLSKFGYDCYERAIKDFLSNFYDFPPYGS